MEENKLPKKALKDFGIMKEDNSFHKKLSKQDIENFLKGQMIIAENKTSRATFRLTDNGTELEVKFYQRDESIDKILKDDKEIHFVPTQSESYSSKDDKLTRDESVAVFIYDDSKEALKQYDLLRDSLKITENILEKNDPVIAKHYKEELLKVREYLLQKISKFPEIAKEIKQNLNVVSNEIDTVSAAFPSQNTSSKQGKSKVELDVNDPDLYQDANSEREIEKEEEQEKRKGRSR